MCSCSSNWTSITSDSFSFYQFQEVSKAEIGSGMLERRLTKASQSTLASLDQQANDSKKVRRRLSTIMPSTFMTWIRSTWIIQIVADIESNIMLCQTLACRNFYYTVPPIYFPPNPNIDHWLQSKNYNFLKNIQLQNHFATWSKKQLLSPPTPANAAGSKQQLALPHGRNFQKMLLDLLSSTFYHLHPKHTLYAETLASLT